MFTGLIEAVGVLKRIEPVSAGLRLVIQIPFSSELNLGDSIAVDGVCLTVVKNSTTYFEVDVIPETLSRTTLSLLCVGSHLNLERALQIGARLGGHFVQGHVDGLSTLTKILNRGKEESFEFEIEDLSLLPFIALKGSIALNGVSLTVSNLRSKGFTVSLIPYTLSHTTFSDLKLGDKVNLEVDLIARYIQNKINL